MSKIIIYIVIAAVAIGGAYALLGGKSSVPSSPKVAVTGAPQTAPSPGIKTPSAPSAAISGLYNASGDVDCNYFWNDAQNSCSGIKNTRWTLKSNWNIDAQAHGCSMTAIGPDDREVLTLGITDFKGVSEMQKGTPAVDLAYKTALDGSAFIGTPVGFSGLGTKAYKVLPDVNNPVDALQIVTEKSTWIVNLLSLGSSLCHSEDSAVAFVRAVANKLP